ncbi:hypothetical protein HPB50_024496 [Hyalomma asiaticum]|uniref:Uncharacterized protein n=1 Tax=Hyalomma asiaticum TaxID=266040 RepID=A0ACB7T158_HYAAI|nr:hypothetical protein HPB50_024496 [Hyalomma asiaticum]
MPGGKQSTAPSRSQQGLALCAYSVSVVLGTALLLRFLVPRLSLLSQRAPAGAPAGLVASDACCPDLLRELATTVNESVDPCDDFVRYACGDIGRRIRRRDYEESWFHSHLWLPAMTGAARDEASVLLRQVYLSCVRNDFRPKTAFTDAAVALREALNLRSTDALSVPALIVKITASFRIKLFIHVTFVHARSAPSCNIAVSEKVAVDIDGQAFDYQGDTAKVFGLRDGPLNLTSIHMDVLGAIRGTLSDWIHLVKAVKDSDVKDEPVNVSSHLSSELLWRAALVMYDLWQPRMQITMDEALLVQRIMQVFMVTWPEVSVVYIFHLSTWSLVADAIGDRYTLAFPGEWQDSCSRELRQYHYLWAAAAAYKKTSGVSDLVVASFIDALLGEVQAEIVNLFPDIPLHIEQELDFVLPAELFPADWSVPNVSASYWANRLVISEWLTGVMLSSESANPPLLEKISIGKPPPTTFFVDPAIYAHVRDDVGERFAVNDALFGVDLATWVWEYVLENVSRRNSSRASEFVACLANTMKLNSTRQTAVYLAVRSILKIRRAVDWDGVPFSVGNLKSFSSSKLFYVVFLNQGMCKKALSGLEVERDVRAYAHVLRNVANFQHAFKCPPTGTISEYCFSRENMSPGRSDASAVNYRYKN